VRARIDSLATTLLGSEGEERGGPSLIWETRALRAVEILFGPLALSLSLSLSRNVPSGTLWTYRYSKRRETEILSAIRATNISGGEYARRAPYNSLGRSILSV